MAVGIDVTIVKRKEYLIAIIALNVIVWTILVCNAEKDKIRRTRGNQGFRHGLVMK